MIDDGISLDDFEARVKKIALEMLPPHCELTMHQFDDYAGRGVDVAIKGRNYNCQRQFVTYNDRLLRRLLGNLCEGAVRVK